MNKNESDVVNAERMAKDKIESNMNTNNNNDKNGMDMEMKQDEITDNEQTDTESNEEVKERERKRIAQGKGNVLNKEEEVKEREEAGKICKNKRPRSQSMDNDSNKINAVILWKHICKIINI